MIYFKDELRKKAEALHTFKDFADAFKDLSRIEYTINHIFTQADLEEAKKLDDELYRKYPEITIMLTIANAMPKINSPIQSNTVQQLPEVERLIQDKFGIYAHILLKSKDIKDIKDFIDFVD